MTVMTAVLIISCLLSQNGLLSSASFSLRQSAFTSAAKLTFPKHDKAHSPSRPI